MSNRCAQVFLAAMTVVLGARAAEAASWLAKHAAVDFENGGFLDALAKHFGTRYAAERAAAQDVVWKCVAEKEAYPVAGFEQPARRLLLLRGLRLAENGAWSECRE